MRVEDCEEPRAGTEARLGDLLRQLSGDLDRILASFRVPLEDAEDLVQNVAVQFLRKRRHIRTPEAWLRGAVRNECRMYWRSRSRRLTVAVDESVLELMAGAGPADQERMTMRKTLARFIRSLPRNCRSLLRMRYNLGLDVRETAEKTGYQPSSVDKVTRRCLQRLSRKVAAAALVKKGART